MTISRYRRNSRPIPIISKMADKRPIAIIGQLSVNVCCRLLAFSYECVGTTCRRRFSDTMINWYWFIFFFTNSQSFTFVWPSIKCVVKSVCVWLCVCVCVCVKTAPVQKKRRSGGGQRNRCDTDIIAEGKCCLSCITLLYVFYAYAHMNPYIINNFDGLYTNNANIWFSYYIISPSLLWHCYLPSALWHCWLGVTKGIWSVKKLSDEVLAYLSVWSEMQMICISSGWCHRHLIISWLLH